MPGAASAHPSSASDGRGGHAGPTDRLPVLPDEMVDRIAVLACQTGGLRAWCVSWRGTCRRFSRIAWFEDRLRGGAPIMTVPSREAPTIQLGISLARPAAAQAAAAAASARRHYLEVSSRDGRHKNEEEEEEQVILAGPIVLVRPGVYPENVRVTRSCALVGWGEGAVVEGTGWEPALAFAGLGMLGGGGASCGSRGGWENAGVLDVEKRRARPSTRGGGAETSTSGTSSPAEWAVHDTGERAFTANVTLRCRNRMQAYAVVVVNGQPSFRRCNLRGGLLVLGHRTRPKLRGCDVRESRGAGVKVTDHGEVVLESCVVADNAMNGILAERSALATLENTVVRGNGAEAVLHTPDTPGVRLVGGGNDVPPIMVRLVPRDEAEVTAGDGESTGESTSANVEVVCAMPDVVVSLGPNVRRLEAGAELQEHLYGEAPSALWFRGQGLDDADEDEGSFWSAVEE